MLLPQALIITPVQIKITSNTNVKLWSLTSRRALTPSRRRQTHDAQTFSRRECSSPSCCLLHYTLCHPPSCSMDQSGLLQLQVSGAIYCLIQLGETLGQLTELRNEHFGKLRKDRMWDLKKQTLCPAPTSSLCFSLPLTSFSPNVDSLLPPVGIQPLVAQIQQAPHQERSFFHQIPLSQKRALISLLEFSLGPWANPQCQQDDTL